MSFQISTKVRFGDVDPAGIVFYPRYFEMLNAAVEDWFAELGLDFSAMHLTSHCGVPTVRLECDFVSPAVLGEELTVAISPKHVGRSSCTIGYVIECDGQVRLKAKGILVMMDLTTKRSIAWPEAIRERMMDCLAPD